MVLENKPTSGTVVGRGRRDWETTRWSLIAKAKSLDAQALAALCDVYWQPVFSFIRARGVEEELAGDVTQGVFEELLRRDLRTLDLERGARFRSWLRRVAYSHLLNVLKHKNSQARGGRAQHLSLDTAAVAHEPSLASDEDQDHKFDQQTALILIERAWARLREPLAPDELPLFEHLKRSLSEQATEMSDQELCRALDKSDSYVRVNRDRMKKQDFPEALRTELASIGVSKRRMNEELRALLDALS